MSEVKNGTRYVTWSWLAGCLIMLLTTLLHVWSMNTMQNKIDVLQDTLKVIATERADRELYRKNIDEINDVLREIKRRAR